MNDGAWEIASARLCADCVRAMWLEYIFAPTRISGRPEPATAAASRRSRPQGCGTR